VPVHLGGQAPFIADGQMQIPPDVIQNKIAKAARYENCSSSSFLALA